MIKSAYFKENPKFSLFLLILCAYCFSVLCRFYWVVWASSYEDFFWNNQLMIISNDGYVFAEGARDMIAGFHQENDLSFFGSPLSSITYYLYELTPFNFESIILYMSVFFGSLIVVPIILIANLYKQNLAGFLAALLASIANSYYNRTMAGYYDTDMLVIVLAMFILFFMIRLIIKKDFFSLFALPLMMIFFLWYYPSSYTLNCAFILLFFIYTLIFHRKDNFAYLATIFMIIAISSIAWYYQCAIIALFLALFAFKQEFFKIKFIILLGLFALILLVLSGGVDPIIYQLKFYIFKDSLNASAEQAFSYFNVNQTIQEVSSVDWSVFMQRISASETAFFCSLIGLFLLCKEHKSFILTLPMFALGFLALRSGLRFTIYAVPVMALGFGYFVHFLLQKCENLHINKTKLNAYIILSFSLGFLLLLPFLGDLFGLKVFFIQILSLLYSAFPQSLQLGAILFCVGVFLVFIQNKQNESLKPFILCVALFFSVFFAFSHIYNYKAPSVFTAKEVSILNDLKSIASREDYVVAWWDYGYPVRYYSDVKTLADGGKHLGKDNFFPSFILSHDQISAANMARLSVEYTEKSFKTPMNDLLKAMMKDYNISNEDVFLHSLQNINFQFKDEKTRDIFLYMPARMINIFSTVASFSKIDLNTGFINSPFVFSPAFGIGQESGFFILSNGMLLSDDFRSLAYEDKEYSINTWIKVKSLSKGEFDPIKIDDNGRFFVLFIEDKFQTPMQFLIMDKSMFESAFVQMFFLNNYDKNLFDLIINDNQAKIFKLKR
ncbi:STT3 domain-containing protein [Campylobacter sp. MIT 99-7217]|uniref:STT3 domain-containing protein n=1 Tax=Campylobacter sp. MIT 99-7217 TaxID=535091 RepID=UPI0039184BED